MTDDRSIEHIPDHVLEELAYALQQPQKKIKTIKAPNLLLQACQIIFDSMNVEFESSTIKITTNNILPALNEITQQANVKLRQISFDNHWWQKDCGPLLAFAKEDHHPYALLPDKNGHYFIIDPATGEKEALNDTLIKRLSTIGYMFYRTLPHQQLGLHDLFKFSFNNNYRNFARIVLLQVFIIALSLLIPIATGIIMAQVIPNSASNLLIQFVLALMVNTVIITLFKTLQIYASIRFRLKINAALQPALWNRLLNMNLNFFRKFSAGDLINRANGIDEIQQQINTSIFVSIISVIVSIITFFVMLYYSVILTLFTVLLALGLLLLILFFGIQQYKYLQEAANTHGKLTGLLLQLFSAITQLKVTHTETSAFQEWNHGFSHKIKMQYHAGKIATWLATFSSLFSTLTTIILFVTVYLLGQSLSFGDFIAFNGLYTQFFAGLFELTSTLILILRVVPIYKRLEPILVAQPNLEKEQVLKEPLTGLIEMRDISFRYVDDQPLIIHSFSLQIKPGESAAIIGPSGSGKSTLFRLLLGLENPEIGVVFYDNHDLTLINKKWLRQQIGVVLQQVRLLPGTILDNLIGFHEGYTLEDAWEAVKLAELAQDIEAMPLNMHTFVSENGQTLSMGQRQRLLIARALIIRPRILILDEATSFIDNKTQFQIFENLKKRKITTIISSYRERIISAVDHQFRVK